MSVANLKILIITIILCCPILIEGEEIGPQSVTSAPQWLKDLLTHFKVEDFPKSNSSVGPQILYVHNLILQTNCMTTSDPSSLLGSQSDSTSMIAKSYQDIGHSTNHEVPHESLQPSTRTEKPDLLAPWTNDTELKPEETAKDASKNITSDMNKTITVSTTEKPDLFSLWTMNTELKSTDQTDSGVASTEQPEITTTEPPPVPHRKFQVNGFNPIYLPNRDEMTDWTSRANSVILGSGRLFLSQNARRRHRGRRYKSNRSPRELPS